MNSLLIDTHSNKLNLVLYKDQKVVELFSYEFNNQSKIVIPKIIEFLDKNDISFNRLDEIIVVNGPGSFTGVRIGVTIAKTIAYCLNISIKSISSLKLKALGVISKDNYSVSISDSKGHYIGEFDSNCNLLKDYFYLSNTDFEIYKTNNKLVDNENIKWDLIYDSSNLSEEDFFNIKPLYIKKIEVEK